MRAFTVSRDGRVALGLGVALSAFWMVAAVGAPWLAPGDPAALGAAGTHLAPPSAAHPLGTDLLGRDVLARLIHGSRVSLFVGWLSVAVSVALGLAVGLAAGLGPRAIDRVLMQLTDAFLAFPRVFLVLLLISLARPSLVLVMTVLGLTGWMPLARLVRADVLSLRERDFVAAARGLGLGPWRVAAVHVVPHLVPTVLAAATLRIGGAILAEAFLSYLGLGAQEPTVSWGSMSQQGRGVLVEGWWLTTFPGLALALTVLGYNLLGDGLREAWNPRAREAARD